MSRALIVTPDAEADLLEGFLSYEEKQLGLGGRFLDEIEQSFGRIASNPNKPESRARHSASGRAYFSLSGVLYR